MHRIYFSCKKFYNAGLTISNKHGIGWYWLALTTHQVSFIASTIPVLLWFHHNMALTVLFQSGIVTVQIVAMFRKPSTLRS